MDQSKIINACRQIMFSVQINPSLQSCSVYLSGSELFACVRSSVPLRSGLREHQRGRGNIFKLTNFILVKQLRNHANRNLDSPVVEVVVVQITFFTILTCNKYHLRYGYIQTANQSHAGRDLLIFLNPDPFEAG